jgi:Protein of unknown function (DUF2934)
MSDFDKPTEERIRERAYQLYLERGGEPGREVEDWLLAEQELGASESQSGDAQFPRKKTASA